MVVSVLNKANHDVIAEEFVGDVADAMSIVREFLLLYGPGYRIIVREI